MTFPKLSTRREQFDTRQQNAQEQARAQAARQLNRCPFLQGRVITVTFQGAATIIVTHGLGVPAKCFPISPTRDTTNFCLVREATGQVGCDPNNQLIIVASTAGTLDLWFYPSAAQYVPPGASQSP